MPRFCMITTFYPPYSFGGDAIFVQSLSRALAARGHNVDVIHCLDSYRALRPRTTAEPATEHDGVTIHALCSRFGTLSPLATQQTGHPLLKSAGIRRILESKPFDVIHFHNISLIGGPALLRMGRAVKLYTIHEHWLLCPMHTLFRDNRELCTRKSCFSCALHYGRPPQMWRYGSLLAESVAHVDAFLAPTEFTRQIHLDSGLPMRIRVLGSFHEQRETLGERAQLRPFFLYVGRLEKLKGVEDLIEVFRGYPDADLLIAGEGADGPRLRALAKGSDHVRFLGHVEQSRLAGLYSNALAVLVPSVAHEVFPLVVLESFAASTPVIARNRGSLAEIVNTSGGGFLFNDRDELRVHLHRMQSDPTLRSKLGESGHAAWRKRWTLDVHLDRYLSIVEELLAAEPNRDRKGA
ncbi:MAG TPA: glycosyltransferase family 4 protein [Bryobacteraceae bacterium]|nr:glycosyltransferase family 4 protein [Bryobacteraceae bacterium]